MFPNFDIVLIWHSWSLENKMPRVYNVEAASERNIMWKEGEGRLVLLGRMITVLALSLSVVSLGAVWGVSKLAVPVDTAPSSLVQVALLPTPSPARAPSMTPVPSATAAELPATVVPPPISTEVPATVTPVSVDVTPTWAALPTYTPFSGQVIISDTFDNPSSGFPFRDRETWSAQYVDGHYEMTLTGQPNAGVSTVFTADNYRLSAEIAVFEGQAGLIFLSTPPAIFYRLMLSPDGSYIMETLSQGNDNPTILVPRTAHQALNRGVGASNRVTVERHGANIQFFVNDQPLTAFTIPPGEYLNQYGFAVASPFGRARANFDTMFGEFLPN